MGGVIGWFLTMLPFLVFAQTRTISGKITDSKDNNPLPGVTIQVKGAKQAPTEHSG
jgi:hypothetical protein